jgi:hypothetical protein
MIFVFWRCELNVSFSVPFCLSCSDMFQVLPQFRNFVVQSSMFRFPFRIACHVQICSKSSSKFINLWTEFQRTVSRSLSTVMFQYAPNPQAIFVFSMCKIEWSIVSFVYLVMFKFASIPQPFFVFWRCNIEYPVPSSGSAVMIYYAPSPPPFSYFDRQN